MRAFAASQPAAQASVGPKLLKAQRKEAEQWGARGATLSVTLVWQIPETAINERVALVAVAHITITKGACTCFGA